MDDQIEKNKDSIEDILKDVESIKDKIEEIVLEMSEVGDSADAGEATSEIIFNGETRTVLHWIDPSTEGVDCALVTSLSSARQAFNTAAVYRDSVDDRPEVQHGDFMILLCEPQPDPNDPSAPLPTPCYYIGLCVEDNGFEQLPPADTAEFSQFSAGSHYRNRYFIAWNPCGAGDGETTGYSDPVNIISNLSITQTSPSADGCFDVTVSWDARTLSFTDGLLKTVSSPTSSSTTFKSGCGEVDLCIDPWPETITVEISGQPAAATVITDGTYVLNLIQGANFLDIHNGIVNAKYGSNGNSGENNLGNTAHDIEILLDGVGDPSFLELNQTSTPLSNSLAKDTTSFNCELPITFSSSNLNGATVTVKL